MKFNIIKRIGIFILAISMFLGVCPFSAMASEEITVLLEDVTTKPEAMPVLPGEAKIKVSAVGKDATLNIAQLAFSLETQMEYKSVKFLIENPDGVQSSLQAGVYDNLLYAMAVYGSPVIELDADTPVDLFILTFSGEAGDEVTLELYEDEEISYFAPDYPSSSEIFSAAADESETAEAIAEGAEPVNAEIKLVMTKVPDFEYIEPEDGEDSGLSITIIGEDEKFPVMFTVPIEQSTGAIPPTVVLNTKLVKGETYTVEVTGAGYIPCTKTGYSFDGGEPLVFTNDDFKPGELIEDGVINGKDKAEFDKILASGEYSLAADFNRDSVVNSSDRRVYAGIADEPQKVVGVTAVGGANALTVSWTKPGNADITGYVIKYGVNSSNLAGEINIDNPDTVSYAIPGLNAGTTYYVQVAAKNSAGVGEFSDIVSAATALGGNQNPGGGGNSGGGGSGGGGGGAAVLPSVGGNAQPNGEFADIGNYSWAKDAIYKLKEKGIISGTSSTTFSPQNNIKRGDFILILTRMLGISDASGENFADVPAGSYYYNAIGAAKAAGIAQGSGDSFMPEESITRQDLITLAYRAFLKYGYISEALDLSSLDAFLDNSLIASYAKASMASMVGAGIIKGSDGNVNPLGNATRAEVAVMCSRLLELIK